MLTAFGVAWASAWFPPCETSSSASLMCELARQVIQAKVLLRMGLVYTGVATFTPPWLARFVLCKTGMDTPFQFGGSRGENRKPAISLQSPPPAALLVNAASVSRLPCS
jgi:hypothetical protein